MALIGNYNVFNKIPGRNLAGNATCDRSDFNRAGASRNFYYADYSNFNLDNSKNTHPLFVYSKQVGYVPPYSWNISQYGGGMAINAVGTSILNLPLIPQQPIQASLYGSGTIAANILGLGKMLCALSGNSSFSASINANGNIVLSTLGTGGLTATIFGNGFVSIGLSGTGGLTATSQLLINMLCTMIGSGDINATMSSLIAMICSMNGSSTLSIDIIGQKGIQAS